MISNAEYFAQDQDLADAYAAGEMTRAAYIAARVALADEWAVPATLAAQVVDFTAEQRTVLDQIGLLNLTGTVASVGDLPGGAANGDTYVVTSNGHAYIRLTGVWKDLGTYGGRGGIAVFPVEGEPDAALGMAGDLALDLETGDFYGPKDADGWGAPVIATGLEAKVAAAQAAKDGAEIAKDLAFEAAASITAITTYETLDLGRLLLLDAGGRIVAETPDPSLVALSSTAASAAFYETTDLSVVTLILDAGGRIISETSAPATATAVLDALFYETTDTAIVMLVLDAGGRVVNEVPSASASAEVIAARGATASLSSRLAASITPDGAPIVEIYGRSFMRQTHMRLTRRSPPILDSIQFILNGAGDSFIHNPPRAIGPVTDILVSRFGDAGGGWSSIGFLPLGNVAPWTLANQPSYLNGNVRPATYPTRVFGNIVGTYYSAASPDLACATLSQAGDYFTQTLPATPIHNGCDLLFIGTANGVLKYRWGTYNGSGDVADSANYTFGSFTNFNAQGTLDATQVVALTTGIPSGASMLWVEWVSGVSKVPGVNLKSAAPGVRVNKIAATGSTVTQWAAAPATQFEAGLAALGAHAFLYLDGTNSQNSALAASNWGAAVSTLIGRVRSASPGIDTLLITPAENQRPGNAVGMPAYALEGRKRAMALRSAFLDLQPAFGDPSNPAEYGSSGAVPLNNADLIHPELLTGGRLMVAEIARAIIPF